MKHIFVFALFLFIFSACSSKKDLLYLSNSITKFSDDIIHQSSKENKIEIDDILKIDVKSLVPEANLVYNKISSSNNTTITSLRLEGYLVNSSYIINFPVLGEVSCRDLSCADLQSKIVSLLLDGNHLINPTVNVRRLNSKFTILGEVNKPGTFSYFDENLNLFQALGYAGDLTINGNRKEITIVREENGLRFFKKINLTNPNLVKLPYYQIRNNDVIIVNPNYNKIKSAGFIGSPASFASFASILLSITLLIINK